MFKDHGWLSFELDGNHVTLAWDDTDSRPRTNRLDIQFRKKMEGEDRLDGTT